MDFKKGDLKKIANVVISEPEKEVVEFLWKIKSFSKFSDRILISPVFTSPITKTEWVVNTRSGLNGGIRFIYFDLRLVKAHTPFPVEAVNRISFLDSEMKIGQGSGSNSFTFNGNDELREIFSCRKDVFMNFIRSQNGYLSDDGSISVLFQITTTITQRSEVNSKVEEMAVGNSPTNNRLSLNSLLDDGKCTDLTLSTKTSSFPTSKKILAAQSKVFKAMFEPKENVIEIEGFSDETVKGLLEFLHEGKTDSLKDNAVELLKISEKYNFVNLKKDCENYLMEHLNKENAADLLILANQYNSTALKSEVIAFVKTCRKEFASTESYKKLKMLHPQIFLGLYEQLD